MLVRCGCSASRATHASKRFPEGRSETTHAVQVNRRFHRDERQRHELGEASGTCLQLADPQDMPRPVTRMVDMTEHDGGGRPDAEAMRGLDYLEPLCGGHLIGTDDGPHLIVEDLGRGPGHRSQSGTLELGQELAHESR